MHLISSVDIQNLDENEHKQYNNEVNAFDKDEEINSRNLHKNRYSQ